MIERYEVEGISKIWGRRNKFQKWLDVEIAITEVWHEWGEVPDASLKNIKQNANFDLGRIDEIEKKVQHDVIAFLTSVEESIGKDSAYVHKGIAKEIISVGKISGSVGTYIHFSSEGEEKALEKLNLKACKVSTQIIQRDRHMEVLYALASLGSLIEKIAVEIRHLQRTDVLEVEEPFSKGQKGSSSMPHKRNPVKCERISGLARLLRGNLSVAFENNILWHERDISHSSAERVIFPDSFHSALFMLKDIIYVIDGLNVYPENIKKNLDITNEVYYSQKILTLLLDKGIGRQKVYELVQECALESWKEKKSFRKLIFDSKEINAICSKADLENAFSKETLLRGIGDIYKRFET